MADTAIKANEREAARMFERGVAAARSGQRRLAAGLLSRTVQLDPQHEQGWLWLSGVIDNPQEIAFCLRTVLTLNPANERARRGLAWLEERAQASVPEPAVPEPAASAADEATPPPPWWQRARQVLPQRNSSATELYRRQHGESWWVNWRRSRRELSRVRLIFWAAPLVLLVLTLALNMLLRTAIDRNTVLIADAMAAAPETQEVIAPVAVTATILQPDPAAIRDAEVLAYLSAIDVPRAELRVAVQSYRNATSQPGGTSIGHASVARRLGETLAQAHSIISALDPPPGLEQAHLLYLAALEQEQHALDDMVSFYSSFQIQLANRAALTMDDASSAIRRANEAFSQAQAQIATPPITLQTLR
ncbi:MAG TPA: hypothetical protein PKA05_09665 [Roseiflexaceae bacterium]|nr:hypothetical protein [Roseiflexaceae bacterium]HMP40633.1 hypothetical protein [Roseiflexaceae bacterium]